MKTKLLPQINSKTGGLAYSMAALCFLVVNLVASIIITAMNLTAEQDGYVYLSYLVAPVALFAAVIAIMKLRALDFGSVFPVKTHPKYYLIALMLIFGLLFSLSKLNTLFIKLFSLMGYEQRDPESYMPDLSGGKVIGALIVIALLPAVLEEALFRGIMLNTCEKSMGTIRTVFIIGFAFSLYHTSPEQTAYQFVCGCAFAFLALRAHSIVPAICMHFLNNAVIIIFSACGLLDAAGELAVPLAADITLTVLGALSLIGGVVWLALDKQPREKCTSGGVAGFFIFASVGIFLFALLWILQLFGIN